MTKKFVEGTDTEWIKGIAEKDAKTIQRIYDTCFPLLLKFIRNNKGNREDAEDIFQDALIILFKKSNQNLEIETSLKSYFLGVCKYQWFNRMRKRKPTVVAEVDDQYIREPIPNIDALMEDEEKRKLFKRKFMELSPSCREVLTLFFNGESMQKIATKLGFKSEGYAKKRKFNCKKALIALIQADPIFKELMEGNS